ncbi:hypothetical protein JOL79_02620 [Microbispora sp. RL4-1S]|uniref:Uncharacterized protein n=1 Tax=Microbispora oryzae TaxID=2806554 RepID=A0A940WH81_9ACTN|nr:hypothetical protein [Microbispora oryzae]MBP2702693.1 hypothetical protein [Microbispora oryzae]
MNVPDVAASATARVPAASRAAGPARPRLVWVFLAWLLFPVLLVAGVGGAAADPLSGGRDLVPATPFSSGQTMTAGLGPGDRPAVYAAAERPTDVRCEAADDAGRPVRLARPTAAHTISDGGTRWDLLFVMSPPAAGVYQVTCDGEDVTFGVGRAPATGAGDLADGLATGGVTAPALPLVGFLSAVLVTIVVLVRRRAAT